MTDELTTTKSVLEALQNDDVKTLKEYLLGGTFNVLFTLRLLLPYFGYNLYLLIGA